MNGYLIVNILCPYQILLLPSDYYNNKLEKFKEQPVHFLCPFGHATQH